MPQSRRPDYAEGISWTRYKHIHVRSCSRTRTGPSMASRGPGNTSSILCATHRLSPGYEKANHFFEALR